jgi:hypothetical protein
MLAHFSSRCLTRGGFPLVSHVQRVVPLALGALLLLTAGLKIHELSTEPAAGKDLGTSRWFLIALSDCELLLGTWLLAGVWPKACRIVALATFGVFAVIALDKTIAGDAFCGCLGKVPFDPRYALILDVAAVVALVAWRPGGHGVLRVLREIHFAGILALLLLIGGATYISATRRPPMLDADGNLPGSGTIVLLRPEKWVGERLPLLKYIDIGDRLKEGKWIVLLYHDSCPDCRKAIPKYERLAGDLATRKDGQQVAIIEVPPYATAPLLKVRGCVPGRLDETKEWFVRTPVEVALDGGIVYGIRQ